MEREPDDSDVVAAFREEVDLWAPRHVPNLVDVTVPREHHWQRPVLLASRFGAAALAIVLLLSALLVVAHPGFPGSSDLVERLSLVNP